MSAVEIALLGGSLRQGSISEQVLRTCAELAIRAGARVSLLPANELALPPYAPGCPQLPRAASRMLTALRRADGIVLATPTYHGGASGLLKNALDYAEELAADTPAYLTGRAVGVASVAWSEHGAATAVADLRNTVMHLRGWVTPMAVTVNSGGAATDADAVRADPRVLRRLEIMVGQVIEFADRTTPEPAPTQVRTPLPTG